jgi:hypothetical protein
MSKLQKKPSALKRGHPTLQNMNFYKFFSTSVGHFCPSGSGSTGPIESGSGSETLPSFHDLESAQIFLFLEEILETFFAFFQYCMLIGCHKTVKIKVFLFFQI